LTSLRRMVSSIGGDSSRKPSASSSPTWLAASIGQG
jgi:hypothetical protein